MSDLRGLIERVEKATGPDREIDWAIADATNHPSFATRFEHMWPPFGIGSSLDCAILDYTASVDAALALVEKMRPGYQWGVSSVGIKIGTHPDGKAAYGEGFRAHVTKNSPLRPMPSTADAPTPALAIILALLRSLDTDNKGAAHGAP